jgi:transcriptional regulator with XRE-family HTH domain
MVRDVRKRLGLTQEKFASRLGVAFPTVSRWENGRTVPSPLAFRQLEGVLREMEEEGADLLKKYFTAKPEGVEHANHQRRRGRGAV